MFYNALARKGKLEDTDEREIDNVVAMHNNMNEKTWRKVVEWEETLVPDSSGAPKLLKFQGRPSDLSPKAALKYYLFGHPLPYDRHDWTIVRDDGTTVRYVIDYYYDESRASDDASSAMPNLEDAHATPSLLVDVRPALDGPTQVWNRIVTMPYARRISQSTNFEPLPLRATGEMKAQVGESVHVWQNIQAAVAGKGRTSGGVGGGDSNEQLDENQAMDLASSFAQIRTACRAAEQRVDECDTAENCAKASMGLTMCMGKILCPLQHNSLFQALSDDGSSNQEARIEAAITTVSECVTLKSRQHTAARQRYSNIKR